MFLGHNSITDGETYTCTFANRFGREEGVKELLFNVFWNTRTVVSNIDVYLLGFYPFSSDTNGWGWQVSRLIGWPISLKA